MEQRTWRRTALAGALTTAAFAAWRWGFSPVVGGGTLVPWTVLGLLVVLATVGTDRCTRPFAGIGTTAAAAVVADLLTGAGAGPGPSDVVDLVGGRLHVALAAGGMAALVSGLHVLLAKTPRARRPWTWAVVALGASAWVAWMGWWPLDDSGPARPDALVAGAAGTLLVATVLGEVTLGRWWGGVSALAPAALLAVPPLVVSDSSWIVVWGVLTVGAAGVCLLGVGVVAAVRGAQRHLHAAAR